MNSIIIIIIIIVTHCICSGQQQFSHKGMFPLNPGFVSSVFKISYK
jgi:hypothetical protein